MLRRRRGAQEQVNAEQGERALASGDETTPPRAAPLAVLWGRFVRPHFGGLVAAWSLRLTSSLLFLALPWRLRVGLDYIFTTPNPGERTNQLLLMTVVYAGRAIVKHVGAFFMNRFADAVCSKLRVAVFEGLQRRPLEETAQAGVSRLLATLTSDVEAASGGVTTAAVHLLETAAYAVGGIVLCLRLNLRLTFVVLLCVAPTVFLSRLARRALRSTGDAASSARAEVMAAAETSLLSAELVRAYGMEDAEAAIFRRAVARSSSANKDACRLGEFLGGVTSFTSALSLVAVVWAGSMEAFAGRLTAGDLIAFVYYCVEIGNSTEKTFRIFSELMALSGSLERVAALIQDAGEGEGARSGGRDGGGREVKIPLGPAAGGDEDQWMMVGASASEVRQHQLPQGRQGAARDGSQGASQALPGRSPSPPPRASRGGSAGGAPPSPPSSVQTAAPKPPQSPRGAGLPHAIKLEDVWFRYSGGLSPGGPPALRGVNLAVSPGQILAVVGPSGSGKSTLLKLCMGLFAPTQGSVLVAGCSVQDISKEHLRAQIGWVAQGDGSVLPGTVRENIQFGAPSATEEQIQEAAIAAAAFGQPDATGFIQNLPEGFDTKLASRNALSGGMAARISLARALVRRPALLLLDEVSAGLDTVTETEVLSAVRRYASSTGATVVIVAHRLVACRRVADTIAVMRAGEVIESGTHEELVNKQDSLYRTLYKLQEAIGE